MCYTKLVYDKNGNITATLGQHIFKDDICTRCGLIAEGVTDYIFRQAVIEVEL